MIKHLENLADFDSMVASGTHFVDFYATWCGPCKMISPLLEEIDAEGSFGNVDIIKIDIDKFNELASQFRIQYVPTLMIIKDGKEIKREYGYKTKDFLIDYVK